LHIKNFNHLKLLNISDDNPPQAEIAIQLSGKAGRIETAVFEKTVFRLPAGKGIVKKMF
jgi:hypothetical protein